MKAEWKDATSYSRNRERVQTAWVLKLDDLEITILNNHIHYKGEFVMHCYKLGFDTHALGRKAEQVEEAKQLAIGLCIGRAERYLTQLNNVTP